MRVIAKGRKQKGWSIEKNCTGYGNGLGGCGALLLVEQDDIYETRASYQGETDHCRTFKCPECGVETDFKDGEIPGAIWDKTRKK
jgi:hypothetical protein